MCVWDGLLQRLQTILQIRCPVCPSPSRAPVAGPQQIYGRGGLRHAAAVFRSRDQSLWFDQRRVVEGAR